MKCEQKTGYLTFGEDGRYWLDNIALHCGDCFQMRFEDKWYDVRIELAHTTDWYIIGLPTTAQRTALQLLARHYD